MVINRPEKSVSVNHNIQSEVYYLHNYLENYEHLINKLITQFKLTNNSQNHHEILEIIRYLSNANCVFIASNDNNFWHIDYQSSISEVEYYAFLEIFTENNIQLFFNSTCHGVYQIYTYQNISQAFAIIPLQLQPEAQLMFVSGLSLESHFLTDIYGLIIASFYKASLKYCSADLVEASIIDNLKKSFGFLPLSLMQKRFQLFCQRLQTMVIYFEPVIHLDPDDLFISGWEALARNPTNLTSPTDLFQTAELWGHKFITHLDQYFLTLATVSYREQRKKVKQNRPQDIAPLSVNVYPESLMQTEYLETTRQLINDKVISPRNLILEISEKTELPKFHNGVAIEAPLKFFKQKLLEYVKELKIRFAVDDFGVGYASISRLAGLNPPYVKIDREILTHEQSDVIIRFVRELVGANNLNPANVIIEGVEKTNVSLYKLRQMGVSYIQGYIVSKPAPEIYRLSHEKAQEIKKLILLSSDI